MSNLDRPINLTVMFWLYYGKKLDYKKRTHSCMRRTCKLKAVRPQVDPGTLR